MAASSGWSCSPPSPCCCGSTRTTTGRRSSGAPPQASGRPLQIGGKLDLKLFPWLALQIADVSLGNPAGYGTDPFLSVKRADVGVKLLPLLHKEIEVRRVALEGLAVTLVSRSDEDNNWKDLGKKTPRPKRQPTGPAPKTSIAGIDIKDAALIYRDEAEKSLTRLTKLNVHTGALGGERPCRSSGLRLRRWHARLDSFRW